MEKWQKDFVDEMKEELKTAEVEDDPYKAPVIHFHNTLDSSNPARNTHTLSPVEKYGDTLIVDFDGYRIDVPEDRMDEFIYRWGFLEYNRINMTPTDDKDELIKIHLAARYMKYVRYFI